jgi:hypothetical protein
MLDLCAGLQGASKIMRAHGWQVVTLDYDPSFGCDITADVRTWQYIGPRPDLIWASPPCDEFSREFMPWSRTGKNPDMSIVLACKQIINQANPRYWIIENTQGAIRWFIPYLGRYRCNIGPFFLWGHFPPLGRVDISTWRKKESYSSSAPAERAKIPESLSRAVMAAIECQNELPLPNPRMSGAGRAENQ